MAGVHDFTLKSITGEEIPLSTYAGKVLLLVNVASQCGLTPQYEGLEALHRQYGDRGLAVLGFPCNQFGAQEPGSEAEIQAFCRTRYDVTFPLFGKIEVNGENRHPLYRYLAGDDARFPGDITWNFEKFVINPAGEPVARFAPNTTPDDPDLIAAVEREMA